jgi:putative flippase GtrA
MNLSARVVRFNAVGAAGMGVQLSALWLLADVAHVHYMVATPVAVGLAVVHNFIWHWWWTWHDRADASVLAAAFVRFAAANGVVSLAGNLGVMATLVSGAHVEPVVANGVAIGVCGLLNFWLGHTFVFRRVGPAPPEHGSGI